MKRGVLLAVAQTLLVFVIVAKYAWDRERLPEAWAPAAVVDPYLPLRGRYLLLRLNVDFEGPPDSQGSIHCRLYSNKGRLAAVPDTGGDATVSRFRGTWVLDRTTPFFISEHADQLVTLPLWAKVTVVRDGSPRPIALAVEKNGRLIPFQ
jgi:hypothetical protein